MLYNNIIVIWYSAKLQFGKISKRCSINSTPQVEFKLEASYIGKTHNIITCKGDGKCEKEFILLK